METTLRSIRVSRYANLLCDNVVWRSFNLSEKRTALNKQMISGENMTSAILTPALWSNRWDVTLTASFKRNR